MKRIIVRIVLLLIVIGYIVCFYGNAQTADLRLYEKTAAGDYTESTPLGNGFIGAMLFGSPNKERIILNEITLWTGGEQDADRQDASSQDADIV